MLQSPRKSGAFFVNRSGIPSSADECARTDRLAVMLRPHLDRNAHVMRHKFGAGANCGASCT